MEDVLRTMIRRLYKRPSGGAIQRLFFQAFFFQCLNNGEYNSIHILYHVIVPKANRPVAHRFQVFRSVFIVFFLIQMLTR